MSKHPSNWVKLNVGGQVFVSTKETLQLEPKSYLALLIDDPKAEKDEKGAILIDRDPELFSIILSYLRNRHLLKPKHVTISALSDEALYYGLSHLVNALSSKRSEDELLEDCRQYRIMQMSLKDAVKTLSELTDGWKFEHLVKSDCSGRDENYIFVISKKSTPSELHPFQNPSKILGKTKR